MKKNIYINKYNSSSFCAPVRAYDIMNSCAPVRQHLYSDNNNYQQNATLDIAWLEITNTCNLNCLHCYANSEKSSSMSTIDQKEWRKCISTLSAIGFKHLQLIGGEPFLYRELFDLLEHAKTVNFTNIEIYSNMTNVLDSMLMYLFENHISLAFSIYSDNANVHDHVTGVRGSFDRSLRNIQLARDIGVKMHCSVILVDDSIQNIERIEEFLVDSGISNISFDRVRNVGRGSNLNHKKYHCSDICKKMNKLCITSTGDIIPCIFDRNKILGNILTSELQEIVSNLSAEQVN